MSEERYWYPGKKWVTKLNTPCPLLLPCTRCGELLPVTSFYKRNTPGKGRRDILGDTRNNTCIKCQKCIYQEKDLTQKLFYNAKARSKRQGVAFEITINDIEIPEYCPVLGLKITDGTGTGSHNAEIHQTSASLDKIIPDRGYIKTNICIISKLANTLKGDASEGEIAAILMYMKEWGNYVPSIEERGADFTPFATRIDH